MVVFVVAFVLPVVVALLVLFFFAVVLLCESDVLLEPQTLVEMPYECRLCVPYYYPVLDAKLLFDDETKTFIRATFVSRQKQAF